MFKALAVIEPSEVRAVLLSMLYFFFLFGSYSSRQAGARCDGNRLRHQAPAGAVHRHVHRRACCSRRCIPGLASRMKLSTFLPWVYGFVALEHPGVLCAVPVRRYRTAGIAAAFYVWVSTFNMLIISVFWSFMADIFSRTQAKRLFGFVAAGGTLGGIAGRRLRHFLVKAVGNNGLMLISAVGFVVTALLVSLLAQEKAEAAGRRASRRQRTTLDHKLAGNPFDGFILLFQLAATCCCWRCSCC